jgi:3-oxoadipate enol-lactonase
MKAQIAGIEMHYEISGSGPWLTLSHSLAANTAMWDAQMQALNQHFTVLRYDIRGHGKTQATPGPYTLNQLSDDVHALLVHLGIQSTHWMGLSLGGMSGFGLGCLHPDRLLSLCLCDARADMTPAMAAPWDERIALAKAAGCQALASATAERWFGRTFLDAHPAIEQQFLQAIGNTSLAGFEGCARAIQGLDYLGQVGSIRVPTTLIVGANDGPLPQAMQTLKDLIPSAVLEIIADAGHLPNIDQPAAFNAALLRHFAALL